MQHKVELEPWVEAGMRSLNPYELHLVHTVLNRLRDGTIFEQTDPADIRPAREPLDQDGTYVLTIDDSLRLFFRMEPTRVAVLDMIRMEFVRQFQ